MKRHLTSHGLTPQQYRAKWGLPADYPMTAPNYSATRSAMAKDIGLGQEAGRAQGSRQEGEVACRTPAGPRGSVGTAIAVAGLMEHVVVHDPLDTA